MRCAAFVSFIKSDDLLADHALVNCNLRKPNDSLSKTLFLFIFQAVVSQFFLVVVVLFDMFQSL